MKISGKARTEDMNRRGFLGKVSLTLAALACPYAMRCLAGEDYEVLQGDTLSEIAQTHGVRVSEIMQANDLEGHLIMPGQKLRIPEVSSKPIYSTRVAEIRKLSEPLKSKARGWTTLVIHHSAVSWGNAAQYDADHRRRGMANGLAYHFVIGNGSGSGDGTIEVGPRWHRQLQGGHVSKDRVNHVGIGICLVGNFQRTSPTPEQLRSLEALIAYLQGDFLPTPANLLGHKDIDATLCPGRHFPLAKIKQTWSRKKTPTGA